MVKKQKQPTASIEAKIVLPEHYRIFLDDYKAVFGDLDELLSRLLIEEVNRTHEFLRANSPASLPVEPLDDLYIGLHES